MDDDLGSDDLIDTIFADSARNVSSGFSSDRGFPGDSQTAMLTLSFQVTCESDYYGLDCNTFCQAQNNSEGHFSCDSSNGNLICLPGYQNALTHCIERKLSTM